MANSTLLFERGTAHCSLRVMRYPPHCHMDRHAHETDGLSIVLDGALVEEAAHRSVTAGAGWTVLKPAGTYHANRFGPSGATILAIDPIPKPGRGLPSRWQWSNRPAVFRAALQLIGAARADRADTTMGCALADLTELLRDCATERRDKIWLEGVKTAIDDPDEATPSTAVLAARAGVHPVYLAREFRRAFGTSMREYRKIRQVRRAIKLIVESELTLSAIAQTCGYFDHSHMCHAFGVVARINPSALRDPR